MQVLTKNTWLKKNGGGQAASMPVGTRRLVWRGVNVMQWDAVRRAKGRISKHGKRRQYGLGDLGQQTTVKHMFFGL